MCEWIKCDDQLPPLDLPVWLYERDSNSIWIGELSYVIDGTFWGNTYGQVYYLNGRWWSTDNEIDDDYQPTHWARLPTFPFLEGDND